MNIFMKLKLAQGVRLHDKNNVLRFSVLFKLSKHCHFLMILAKFYLSHAYYTFMHTIPLKL